MCEPTTIALGVSAVIGLATAAYSADQTKKAGKANAAIMENNARMDDDAAKAARAAGDREQEQQAWRTRATLGAQRAAIASNGIDSQMGTAAELLGETAMFGEVDQQTIRLNAAQNAWGFNANASNKRNQAAQTKWSGKSQATGTILAGLGSSYQTAYGT